VTAARCAAQLNAYVEAGTTRAERARRLAEVPEAMRASVEGHVRTVFAVRRKRHADAEDDGRMTPPA
jgi:hypothetical protein